MSIARCSRTLPSATPRRSADLRSEPSRPWRCPQPNPEQRTKHHHQGGDRRSAALFSSGTRDDMTDTITSRSNPRLKELRKLHDRKHRERTGLFLAEGEDMLA